jgi:nitrite reductase/ring-hydroxylating ferredoxin subunit/uncharacterized membrane protein
VARFLSRLIAMNDGWAKPFGDANHRWLAALFGRVRPIKDLLNGTWLGHPLHSASTDLPIGLLLGVVVLDLVGQSSAADIVLVLTILAMLASSLSGLADFSDTDGTARTRAALHGSMMVVAIVLVVVSLVLRAGEPADRTLSTVVAIVGFAIVLAGGFVGGDVVYVLGNMVSRHAFRGAGTKWIQLDTGDVDDLTAIAEATPLKMKAGVNDVVVVRLGDRLHALHATCAHAGGPLAKGSITPDGCLECPWHGARYRLTDGAVRRGPSVYDQPSYEIRASEAGGYEIRRTSVAG